MVHPAPGAVEYRGPGAPPPPLSFRSEPIAPPPPRLQSEVEGLHGTYRNLNFRRNRHSSSESSRKDECFFGSMREDLVNAFTKAAQNGAARVVVITGTGRAFSAGGDIEAMQAMQEKREVLPFTKLLSAGSAVVTAIRELGPSGHRGRQWRRGRCRIESRVGVRHARRFRIGQVFSIIRENRSPSRLGWHLLPSASRRDEQGDGDDDDRASGRGG